MKRPKPNKERSYDRRDELQNAECDDLNRGVERLMTIGVLRIRNY